MLIYVALMYHNLCFYRQILSKLPSVVKQRSSYLLTFNPNDSRHFSIKNKRVSGEASLTVRRLRLIDVVDGDRVDAEAVAGDDLENKVADKPCFKQSLVPNTQQKDKNNCISQSTKLLYTFVCLIQRDIVNSLYLASKFKQSIVHYSPVQVKEQSTYLLNTFIYLIYTVILCSQYLASNNHQSTISQ